MYLFHFTLSNINVLNRAYRSFPEPLSTRWRAWPTAELQTASGWPSSCTGYHGFKFHVGEGHHALKLYHWLQSPDNIKPNNKAQLSKNTEVIYLLTKLPTRFKVVL